MMLHSHLNYKEPCVLRCFEILYGKKVANLQTELWFVLSTVKSNYFFLCIGVMFFSTNYPVLISMSKLIYAEG